ncbi:hypothetical protein BO221_15725 [Archangium sp. Cb G35]|uniref:hypothetical protein n=1 Tax=Archangium sp. Cb G35 TaxID=1920190 RepID=UPI00093780BA|nr:hypothetical protein [Archangium sp. Cb G35]OJT24591.1 hypothetical protein BO221_15725 [Archangium sp. Cb G35]
MKTPLFSTFVALLSLVPHVSYAEQSSENDAKTGDTVIVLDAHSVRRLTTQAHSRAQKPGACDDLKRPLVKPGYSCTCANGDIASCGNTVKSCLTESLWTACDRAAD